MTGAADARGGGAGSTMGLTNAVIAAKNSDSNNLRGNPVNDDRLRFSRREALASAIALGVVADGSRQSSRSAHPFEPPSTSQTPVIRSRHSCYGGFLEHIGDLINHSLWSEVLDDRKFYWPVNSEPVPAPPGRNGGPPRSVSNKWRPTGSDSTVTMDTTAPYVGKQSPLVHLSSADALRHRPVQPCAGSQGLCRPHRCRRRYRRLRFWRP